MKLFHKLKSQQKVVSLPPKATVLEAVKLMTEKGIGSVVVLEGDRIAGIFTERDLMNRVVSKGLNPASVPLSQVMSREVVTVDVGESIQSCYAKMQERKSRHVPIIDEGRVVGMVTMRNILESLWKEIEEENVHLKRYIQQS